MHPKSSTASSNDSADGSYATWLGGAIASKPAATSHRVERKRAILQRGITNC